GGDLETHAHQVFAHQLAQRWIVFHHHDEPSPRLLCQGRALLPVDTRQESSDPMGLSRSDQKRSVAGRIVTATKASSTIVGLSANPNFCHPNCAPVSKRTRRVISYPREACTEKNVR